MIALAQINISNIGPSFAHFALFMELYYSDILSQSHSWGNQTNAKSIAVRFNDNSINNK